MVMGPGNTIHSSLAVFLISTQERTDVPKYFLWNAFSVCDAILCDAILCDAILFVAEPNNSGGDEDCNMMYSSDGKWNDGGCLGTLQFVCEKNSK